MDIPVHLSETQFNKLLFPCPEQKKVVGMRFGVRKGTRRGSTGQDKGACVNNGS